MLKQIADLVEFDLDRFTEEQVVTEFNHKFSGTILKVDGKYITITYLKNRVGKLSLYWMSPEFKEEVITKLTTIEKVMPKSGLYASEHGLLYLHKLPKRQWLKSFKIESNYNLLVLATHRGELTLFNTVLVDNPIYQKESIIYRDKVYLHWKVVGELFDGIIHVTNKNFFEEVKELWNQQYQVTLEAKPRQQKEEKLILDF